MNREILFRGKRKDNGEWVYGYFYEREKGSYIMTTDKNNHFDSDKYYLVIPETIGQYTGLKDKNGTKIFEGDIVQWSDVKMEIFWSEDIGIGYGFCWRPYGENQFYHESITGFVDEYEVIGTIYDGDNNE